MTEQIIYIITLILGICVYASLFTVWIVNFNRTGSKKFNFLSYLPFELNGFRRKTTKGNLYLSLILLSSILILFPISVFVFEYALNGSKMYSAFSFGLIYYIGIIIFVILLFIKLSNYKIHLIFALAFVVVQLVFSLLGITFFTSLNMQYVTNSNLNIIIFIILLFQIIFELFLLLNPTYKNWAKMVKIDAETFSRQKYCYLAILEWGTFFNFIANYIVISLVMFF